MEEFYKSYIWGTVQRVGADLMVQHTQGQVTAHFERDWNTWGGQLRVSVRNKLYEIAVPFVPRAVRIEREVVDE